MKSIEHLLAKESSQQELLTTWCKDSQTTTTLLSINNQQEAEGSLLDLRLSTTDLLGSIIYYTGGILADNHWIRILGGGSKALPSIRQWNADTATTLEGYLIVAYDILGGYFCIKQSGQSVNTKEVYYFAPDNLTLQSLHLTYQELIHFLLLGDTTKMYENYRWSTWKKDSVQLPPEHIFAFLPPLWTIEGKNIESSIKHPILVQEHFKCQAQTKGGLDKIIDKYK